MTTTHKTKRATAAEKRAFAVALAKLQALVAEVEALDLDHDDLDFDASNLLKVAVRDLECSLSDWDHSTSWTSADHSFCYLFQDIRQARSYFIGVRRIIKNYRASTISAVDVKALQLVERAIPELESLDPPLADWLRTRAQPITSQLAQAEEVTA